MGVGASRMLSSFSCLKGGQRSATCIDFFFAIARVIVNDDGRGGTAPDPFVRCSGAEGKRRKVIEAARDFAMLPGPQRLFG